ncbi:MAG: MerR family transcriptional regulator [Ignavibacteria bacterium]|nr:MerR family transcriptional regulator [Ignavibacteria bacterium]MBT8381529.1 MerR family transcriptional regulator [Ignavibacteria bacterium]MBT8393015.1 MerR family transcriptional regulator [Ignavibacteria bacterium]NNJ52117.1 MerR family transcriptional regulator [Ignavibacteriaceae bacterium]NNL19800.1 MerR family transcriptional regulator [Ignavibacteriaceae bacterium]
MNNNSLDPVISIGTLAKKVGLSVSAIRKYEEQGLIISHRSASGHRLFSYEDIERLRTIQHLIRNLGFNIEGIRRIEAILPCWDLLPCSEEVRNNCLAFKGSTKPCWMIKDAHCTRQGNECRKCHVYRFGTLHTEGIKVLLHSTGDNNKKRKIINKALED